MLSEGCVSLELYLPLIKQVLWNIDNHAHIYVLSKLKFFFISNAVSI